MKTEILSYILKNLYKLTTIPTCLYHNDKLVGDYHHQQYFFFLKNYYEHLLTGDELCNLTISPQSLAYATIKCGKYTCLIGPTKTMPVNAKMLREILIENDIKLELSNNLKCFIDHLPTMTLEYFALIVSSCYVNINHEILKASEILKKLDFNITDIKLDEMTRKRQNEIIYGDKLPHNTYEFEQKLLYCVRNGLVEEVHKLGGLGNDSNIEVTSPDPLTHFKNLLMSQKTLVSRAAMEGGVDPETAYSLADIFTYKINNCKDYNDLGSVSYAINDTFCKLVKDVKYPKSDNLLVNKAINYINEHITENISAVSIANHLNISREYISSMFKKTIGQSIPEFITERKVAVAKKVLRFTDNPLIEIANYLSFSSQSYFQVQFKKITGMTPLEYRNSPH